MVNPFERDGINLWQMGVGSTTMTHSIYSWLFLVLALLGSLGLLSAIIIIIKEELGEKLKRKLNNVNFNVYWKRIYSFISTERVKKQFNRVNFLTIGLAFGFVFGYAYAIREFHNNTQTLADVLVLDKHDEYNYKLQTDKGQAFEVTFCNDTRTDFVPGIKLKVLNYEQRVGCKSLIGKNLGFVVDSDDNGNRILYK